MKDGNVIEVHDITKTFKIYIDKSNEIKSFMLHSNRRKYEKRQVLKGISFEVKKGEAIGLIGHNGCGKSTTLKLLTRIMYPDTGSIEIKGRVSSLIELGAGFHPDMSGRENIYINASIFGLSKKEIDQRVNDIIAFSELEEFIDNPVRTYSSGMYMRLAFSVAINVDADILLIDEILSVGDAAFQAKCFDRLKEIKSQGTTIVIVSHSLGQIEEICERSIWIHKGVIREEGKPQYVHEEYLDYVLDKRMEIANKELRRVQQEKESESETDNTDSKMTEFQENFKGNGKAVMQDVQLRDENHMPCNMFKTNSPMELYMKFEQYDMVDGLNIRVAIVRFDGVICCKFDSLRYGMVFENTLGEKVAVLQLPKVNLVHNSYFIDIAIVSEAEEILDYKTQGARFEVVNKFKEEGIIRMDGIWLDSDENK